MKVKRSKKRKNLREKSESSSKQNASSNAQNVYKDNLLLNVSRNNDSNCYDKKENLKIRPDSFFGTNTVSKTINVDSNNTQNEKGINENSKTGSAKDEITVVKVNETLITMQLERKKGRHTHKR